MVDYARIQEGVVRSMPQFCVLVPFVILQKLSLENDERLPTLPNHRSRKRSQTMVDRYISEMIFYAWIFAIVHGFCLEDLCHASEPEVHDLTLSHHNYNVKIDMQKMGFSPAAQDAGSSAVGSCVMLV